MQTTALVLPAQCARVESDELTYLTGGASLSEAIENFDNYVFTPAVRLIDQYIVQPAAAIAYHFVVLPVINTMNIALNVIGTLPLPLVQSLAMCGAALITTASLAPSLLAAPFARMFKGTPFGDWLFKSFIRPGTGSKTPTPEPVVPTPLGV